MEGQMGTYRGQRVGHFSFTGMSSWIRDGVKTKRSPVTLIFNSLTLKSVGTILEPQGMKFDISRTDGRRSAVIRPISGQAEDSWVERPKPGSRWSVPFSFIQPLSSINHFNHYIQLKVAAPHLCPVLRLEQLNIKPMKHLRRTSGGWKVQRSLLSVRLLVSCQSSRSPPRRSVKPPQNRQVP